MPRNRTITQCQAIYTGPSPSTGNHWSTGNYGLQYQQLASVNQVAQLHRIQSANYNFSIARQPVNQFGNLAAIDRVILEQPTVNLDLSYILANFYNERKLGFVISSGGVTSAISGMLDKTNDERNFFIKTVAQGNDAVGMAAGTGFVIGIGNGFVTSYSSEGSVGNFPMVSVSIEGLNMKIDKEPTGQQLPAIFPANGNAVTGHFYTLPLTTGSPSGGDLATSALRPGDISLTIGYDEGGAKISDAKIQSYSISLDLSREALQQLGSKYAFAREVNFPVNASLSITAEVGDLTTGNLTEIINNNVDYDVQVNINKPGTSVTMCNYLLKGVNLDSQDFSSSVGDAQSVTMTFSCPIGGPQESGIGIYLSGSN